VSEDARVLCEWIDRTLALPVYHAVAKDSYAEGVVDTLRTVRKLLSKPASDPLPPEVVILRYLTENWSERVDHIDRIVMASGIAVALSGSGSSER